MNVRLVLCAAAAMLAAGSAAHAATSFSFETPALNGGYEYAGGFENYSSDGQAVTEANVTFAGTSGVQSNGSAFGFANTTDGDQTAFLQSYPGLMNGLISLDLGKLVADKAYEVSFVDAARPGYGGDSFDVRYGSKEISYSPASTNFTPQTFSFVAGPTSALIFSAAQGSSDVATAIDGISVSAVPEPATWAMMLLGLGGIGLMMRRAKKSMGFRFQDAFSA